MGCKHITSMSLLVCMSIMSCGKDDGGDDHPPGPGGQLAQQVTADFSGAVGVLVIDSAGEETGLRLDGARNESFRLQAAGNSSDDTSLVKVDKNGDIKSALSKIESQEGCCGEDLPRVQTIAISPNGEVYLHFERPWVYRMPENGQWDDVWDMANGYQCQIFKIKGGSIDNLRNNPPTAGENNLECIDNLHFVDGWQVQRNSVFQFDDDSNVYYPGALPNGYGKMVVYKRSADGSTTTEVINSNICVQDFLVTGSGGVFYTGTSQCEDNNGGDGGFFRYVSPDNKVREIARDWWNFVFEPVEGADGDEAVFFGPDPRSATTASWNTACLFGFDPAAGSTADTSISETITCGSDIWSWINLDRSEDIATYGHGYHNGNSSPTDGWITEFAERCTSAGQIFAGGGSQISSIKQDSNGEVYVIGRVRMKKEGELTCGLTIKGPHCLVAGSPYLPGHATYGSESDCQNEGGTWVEDEGYCTNDGSQYTHDNCISAAATWAYRDVHYPNAASSLCGATASTSNQPYSGNIWDATVEDDGTTLDDTIFKREWLNCQVKGKSEGGHEWTDEYKGLAKVDESTKSLELLSSTDEQAINLWLVNDVPYYSTYNTAQGKYLLKRWNTSKSSAATVAENFEAYNISESNQNGKLFYDGLDFSTNAYSFGTMQESSPYTRTVKTGLTGTVKTIVILP
jgi:hypothetical protein